MSENIDDLKVEIERLRMALRSIANWRRAAPPTNMSIGEVDQKLTSCRSIFEDCGCRGVELALLWLRMF